MFQFKQFSVDQTGCAMKINTDGVLLGALADADEPENILDIGTGTGVIALMLAQRFNRAQIDAAEIDGIAAQTAKRNFKNSPFAERLAVFPMDFESYFEQYPSKKYDFIVSNPPFHINSLESPKAKKTLAKHVGEDFFEGLINGIAEHLTKNGCCWLVLPLQAAELVKGLLNQHQLHLYKQMDILSFAHSPAHRNVLCFGFNEISTEISNLVIYESAGNYSAVYKHLLQPYFIAY